jgi:hypothetical protein
LEKEGVIFMYYFIATIFFYLFPILLLLFWKPVLGTKKTWLRLLLVLQVSMIFHAIFFVRQLIGLYQLAKTMGLKSSSYMPPVLELFQMGILIIWPFLFASKWLASKFWAGIPIWVVLLSLPRFVNFETEPFQLLVNSLFCISLFTGIYGFLWLLKRFPDQHQV